MNDRTLWQISVGTSPEAEEAVAALLERLFGEPASVYVPDDTQQPVVTVFCGRPAERALAKQEALESGLNYIADSGLNIRPAQISIRKVPFEDWAESWKKHFNPIEIAGALLIKPSWSKQQARPRQAVVVLDPGLSFGTGQHPTTAFCLEEIVACRNPSPKSFLDIGCGSGLLSIAAAKLGYKPVRALDSDPVAIRVAKANAKRNRVLERITITLSDLTRLGVTTHTRSDVVCANLIDALLISELSRITNRLKPEGYLVLSGILASQFTPVCECYEAAGLKLIRSRTDQGWTSGTFRRNPV